MTARNLQDISLQILEFMRVASSPPGNFVPGEETLTDLALVGIKRAYPKTMILEKPTKAIESREGHDWVWAVQSQYGYGTMRVQAKKLYKSGRYDMLNHHHQLTTGVVELQLERLIDTSKKRSHVPMYAFYNGDDGAFNSPTVVMGGCCNSPLDRINAQSQNYSPMGVTVVDAHWVRHWMQPDPKKVPGVPKTEDLNLSALPWECLISCPKAAALQGGPTRPGGTGPKRTGPSGSGPQGPRGMGPTEPTGPSEKPAETTDGSPKSDHAGPLPGINPHQSSYVRKLARALQTGDVADGTTGFSKGKPPWLERFEIHVAEFAADHGIQDLAEQTRSYSAIERELSEEPRPLHYVYTDLRL